MDLKTLIYNIKHDFPSFLISINGNTVTFTRYQDYLFFWTYKVDVDPVLEYLESITDLQLEMNIVNEQNIIRRIIDAHFRQYDCGH